MGKWSDRGWAVAQGFNLRNGWRGDKGGKDSVPDLGLSPL